MNAENVAFSVNKERNVDSFNIQHWKKVTLASYQNVYIAASQ